MSKKLERYNTGLFPYIMGETDIKNKAEAISYYQRYMFSRTQGMFKWQGLPETIPEEDLELLIQCVGYACVLPVGGELYAVTGGLGGELSAYYRPTWLTVGNAWLMSHKGMQSGPYTLGTDCAIIKNDAFYMGLGPLFSRYATQLAENDVSIRLAQVNTRRQSLISAQDQKTYQSAKLYLDAVDRGDQGIIIENGFMEGLKTQPEAAVSSSSAIQNLIELQQYLKAGWYNDIGLNANYNMKREAVNSVEAQLGDASLIPLIDQMLHQREIGAEMVNRMYGTNISVTLAGAWEMQKETIEEEPMPDRTSDQTEEAPEEKPEEEVKDDDQV